MLKGKKVIIFDMDGTLIDSVGIWNEVDQALINRIRTDGKNEAEENVQEQRDDILRRFSGAKEPYMEYCGYLKEKYGAALDQEVVHRLRYQIAQDYLRHKVDYKKDADVFIRKLKDLGYILTIGTTTKRSNMDIYRNHNNNILQKARIDDYFTLVYTREDVRKMKPDPEVYLRIMRELNVSAEECLVFEDSLVGIEAAKNAGIEAAAVYDKYSDREREQINERADYRIDSYSQFTNLL